MKWERTLETFNGDGKLKLTNAWKVKKIIIIKIK
jgi:hypothetical protein